AQNRYIVRGSSAADGARTASTATAATASTGTRRSPDACARRTAPAPISAAQSGSATIRWRGERYAVELPETAARGERPGGTSSALAPTRGGTGERGARPHAPTAASARKGHRVGPCPPATPCTAAPSRAFAAPPAPSATPPEVETSKREASL